MWRAEVLELCAVGPSLLRKCHEVLGTIKVAIVVRGDISNEVGRLMRPDQVTTNR
jgi:formylmethanofuran dehydrogenase subunit C